MPSYRTRRIPEPDQQAALEVVANRFGTVHALHPKMSQLRAIVPFDFFAMSGIGFFGLGVGKGVMLASDMPEGFLREFLNKGLYGDDPLSYLISADNHWGSWHELSPQQLAGPKIGRIRQLEWQYGITTRSVVGFFNDSERFGGVTFCRETPFSETERFILEMTTRVVHAELSDQLLSSMNQHLGLSEGEINCLRLLADGLDVGAICGATNLSTETVYSYVKLASKKLGVSGRTSTLVEAFRRKIVR